MPLPIAQEAGIDLLKVIVGGGTAGVVLAVAYGVAKVLEAVYSGRARKVTAEAAADIRQSADERAGFNAVISSLQNQVAGLTSGQQKQYEAFAAIHAEHIKCLEEGAFLKADSKQQKGEIQQLQSIVRRLQIMARDEMPGTMVPALVVADSRGVVLSAMGGLGPLLHWLPAELVGKSIEVLIPERYLDAHRAGMRKVLDTTVEPWTEKAVIAEAIVKDGQEVPVAIVLDAWRDRGEWRFSAEINRRIVAQPAPAGATR